MTRCLLVFGLLASVTPALAQNPAQTGTGGGPGSTITAPNTTVTGQTMPPAGAGGPTRERDVDRRDRMERLNDKIDTGICIGCNK